MSTMRLKLQVGSIKQSIDSTGAVFSEEVSLQAVYGPSGSPNEQWCKWTPTGRFEFTISNPGAMNKLRPGEFYFVDLTPTDKDGI